MSEELMQKAADRIEELEMKLSATYLEALAISDTNNEMAIRIAEQGRELNAHDAELSHVSASIGSVRWMDPPDGGSVSLGEQVNRMRLDLEAAEARLSEAVKVLKEATKGLDMVHDGLMDPTRPRQAVGEVCYHFLSKARAFIATLGEKRI